MRPPIKYHLARIGTGAALLFIIGYALFQGRWLIEGPVITIRTPENGTTTDDSLILVSGIARNAKDLRLDGRPIFIDTEGHFGEQLLLMYGYNIIELTATDIRGKTVTSTLEVVYR